MSENELMHHGRYLGFRPYHRGTDYIGFRHSACEDASAEEIAVLIDNRGRVIVNLECTKCHQRDALKFNPIQKPGESELDRIYLSPKLVSRVGEHRWDDA